ncbi:MAG: hypothetical protein AAFP88_00190 [Bacteroidota bacterium]
MRVCTLIIGLACCVSCDTHDPQILDAWPYIAPKEILEAPRQQAIIQELDWGKIIIKMPNDNLKQTSNREDWWFTPQDCKKWDYKTLGQEFKKREEEIKHITNTEGTGVLPYAIQGLLKGVQGPNIVVIVSTGVDDALGVSDLTREHLKKLKEDKIIEKYYILNSKKVPKVHNECVKAGKRVYTLLHTTC